MNIQQALYNLQKNMINLLQCCHSYIMLNGLIDNKNAFSLSIEFIILRDEWLKDNFGTIKHLFGNDDRFSSFLNDMGSDMNSIGSRDDSNDNESDNDAFFAQLMEGIEPSILVLHQMEILVHSIDSIRILMIFLLLSQISIKLHHLSVQLYS